MLSIGNGVEANRFDPETSLAFASCAEGVLTVVKEEAPDKFSVLENVKTEGGAPDSWQLSNRNPRAGRDGKPRPSQGSSGALERATGVEAP
jgi:hypothetical protein